MPLHVRCQCKCSYRVPESAAGKTFRCKKCKAAIKVPRSQSRVESKSSDEPDDDSLLNQLFDDEDETDAAVSDDRHRRPATSDSSRPANTPPTGFRRTRSHDEPEHRPVHPSFSQLGPLALVAMALAVMVAVAYLHPPLAKTALQVSAGGGILLMLVSYAMGLLMARQESSGYRLLCFVFPPMFLIYVLTHMDEAGGVLLFFGCGLFLTIASVFLGQWLGGLPGAIVLPF